jgi:hypothetical protein
MDIENPTALEVPPVDDDIMKLHNEFYSNGHVDTGSDPLAEIALKPVIEVEDEINKPAIVPADDGAIVLPPDGQVIDDNEEDDDSVDNDVVDDDTGDSGKPDKFAELEKKLKDQEARMSDLAGNNSAVIRKNEILEEMLQKMQQGLGKTEPQIEEEEDNPYDDVLKEMTTEFPEMAKPVKRITEGLQKEVSSLKKELAGMKALVEKVTGTVGNLEFTTNVAAAHKDYRQVAKSDEFVQYVKGLAPGYQKYVMGVIKQGTSDEFIEVIDGFRKTQPASGEGKPNKKVADAAKQTGVKVKGAKTKPPLKESQVINTSNYDTIIKTPADYDKHQKAIMASIAAGTFYV